MRIAILVEGLKGFVRIPCLFIYFLYNLYSLEFLNTSKIVSSECWDYFDLFPVNLDLFWDAVQFRGIALPDDELNHVLSVEIPLLSLEYGDELYADLLLFDQVYRRDYLFEHLLDDKAEFVHLFSAQSHSKNLARGVIDADEDGSAFTVHEGDDGFEEDSFEEFFLDGDGVVFEFDGDGFEREDFMEKEIAFTAETGVFDGDWFEIHGQIIKYKQSNWLRAFIKRAKYISLKNTYI